MNLDLSPRSALLTDYFEPSKAVPSGQKQPPVLSIAFSHDYDSFIKWKQKRHQVPYDALDK